VRAGVSQPWELYSIVEDRTELHDLSKEHPEKMREITQLWEQESKRTFIYPKPDGKKNKP
jgi:arylsulfatase